MSNLHLHRTSRVCFTKTQGRQCRDSEVLRSNTEQHRDADPWDRPCGGGGGPCYVEELGCVKNQGLYQGQNVQEEHKQSSHAHSGVLWQANRISLAISST